MASVSGTNGANGANVYSEVWQKSSPYLQNLGLDSKYSTKIGNILNGNGDAILTDTTNQVVDNLVSDPVANAVVKGAVDIVKTVLIGNYNKGQDIKEAGQNLSDISSITTMGSQIADAGNSSSEQIVQTLQGNMDSKSAEVDEAVAVITTNAQEDTKQIEETVEKNKEITDTIAKNQEQIDKNNAQIQEKQQRLNELASQIASKKAQLGIKSQTPAKPQSLPQTNQGDSSAEGNNVNSDSGQQSFALMSTDGIQDSELQALISEYNSLGVEITGLQQQNATLSTENVSSQETLTDNVETTQDSITESIEVSNEQSAKIDEAANSIISMANDASSAINEVQNVLKGQFPQLDKLTLVKLATSVTKAAVCGTNSGLLATAAATMGVGSVFSFGATAAKAAELGAASADQAAASAKNIATNVAGKVLQQQMTQYMNKTFSDIGKMIGVDLSSMTSVMNQYIQEQSNLSKDSLAQFTQVAQSNDAIKTDEKDTSAA
ncbi:TPA: hypothetical protein CPT80_08185 [Candidatus Gastranaerophilales bacterium HUM_9]|nr:MAG TPA: hypothetical protein CPT80_08185 [Candidatus Gastranaerophilales bacterium HUM_9]HBX34942.1 hypothetical protein [Cyanobacteria bacterium UBA11440]